MRKAWHELTASSHPTDPDGQADQRKPRLLAVLWPLPPEQLVLQYLPLTLPLGTMGSSAHSEMPRGA